MNYFNFDLYQSIIGLTEFLMTGLFFGFIVLGVLKHLIINIVERRE